MWYILTQDMVKQVRLASIRMLRVDLRRKRVIIMEIHNAVLLQSLVIGFYLHFKYIYYDRSVQFCLCWVYVKYILTYTILERVAVTH